jgi:MFS transporter, DHA2 family, multidrug resistance protein
MEVLDTSVANVALPHIAGNLSASTDEATWVLTSYLVSNAVILPATGWLSRRFGRKRFLIACIAIFTLASFASGAATSLGMLVVARILQGVGGGALQPIAQAVLMESFPPEKRGVAMAVYAMGVIVAPIIGPTLGGWITDNYSWRWIFYINIPVGALAIFMANTFIEDPPYVKNAKIGRIDYVGFGLMAVWLASLQIVLDKGQQEDWFATPWIVWFTVVSIVTFVAFVVWELTTEDPIVDLRVLKNRNFAVGTALIGVVGVVLFASVSMLPLFLQTLMGYSALASGLASSPRGFGSILAIIVVGRLIGKIDERFLIGLGMGVLAFSSFMLGNLTLDIGMGSVVVPNVVYGVALGFLFVPLSTAAMGTLSNEQMGNATGIYNLMRNIGGSVGISLVTTMLARSAQTHQAYMTSHVTVYDPEFQQRVATVAAALANQVGAVAAKQLALAEVYATVVRQANLWAYVDNFRMLGFMCLVALPAVFLLRRVRVRSGAAAVH